MGVDYYAYPLARTFTLGITRGLVSAMTDDSDTST